VQHGGKLATVAVEQRQRRARFQADDVDVVSHIRRQVDQLAYGQRLGEMKTGHGDPER